MPKQLPSITPRQKTILKFLYTYRFLNRIQLQALLKHKDKKRTSGWLKDLRDKEYINWHYDPSMYPTRNVPAVYYLKSNGIQHLRSYTHYPEKELRKRYKESTRTRAFITHCLLMADCAITLRDKSSGTILYTTILPANYADSSNEYYFLNELKPHIYFEKRQGKDITNYTLENIEPTLPRYQLRKRLKDYVDYLATWDDTDRPLPIALFVCPTTADLLYIKRRTKQLLEDMAPDERIRIRVTTLNKLQTSGVASMIWEEI